MVLVLVDGRGLVDHSLEAVLVVSGVVHGANGAVSLDQRVRALDHISVALLVLGLDVAGVVVVHSILELVLGVRVVVHVLILLLVLVGVLVMILLLVAQRGIALGQVLMSIIVLLHLLVLDLVMAVVLRLVLLLFVMAQISVTVVI